MSHDREVFYCTKCRVQYFDASECPTHGDGTIANKMQVGGDHYKAEYQHWDWAVDVRLGYLESAATKYLCRHFAKNGPEDIKKAYHYVQKLLECCRQQRSRNHSFYASPNSLDVKFAWECFDKWVVSAEVPPNESGICYLIAKWKTDADLVLILREIDVLYMDASAGATASLTTGGNPTPTKASNAAGGSAEGRAGGVTGQAIPASRTVEGQEHPFGYDEDK